MVEGLNTREASVVRARFGLDGRPLKTLEELAWTWESPVERVRQIESSALKNCERRSRKPKK